MNRKTSCVTQIANVDNTCFKCDKNFSTYVSLWQHVNNNICGKMKKKGKMKIPKKIKELTWYKYIGKEIAVSLCMCCNETEICQMNFHCGHNISEANGGDIKVENMRPICSGCNSSMGSMNMNDFIKKFKLNGKIIESQVTQKTPHENIVNPIAITRYKNENGKTLHQCNKCDKIFKQKCNYNRHLNRQVPCNEQIANEKNECKMCLKIYSDVYSLHKHIKKCTRILNKTINSNAQNDCVVIYDGEKWNINKKEDTFKDIIYVKSDFLCVKFRELLNQMTKTDVKKMK